jgi:hypothetical protein
MKKLLPFMAAINTFFLTGLSAQTVLSTDHRTSTQTLKMQAVPELTTAHGRLWDLANKQNGVIGTNFKGEQEIGNAAAQRSKGDIDFWFPIENYKRTVGGVLKRVNIVKIDDLASSSSDFADYDHNFHVSPIADYQEDFDKAIEIANLRMDWKDPYVDPNRAVAVAWGDCIQKMRNRSVADFEFEIDLSLSNLRNFVDHGKSAYIRASNYSTQPDTLFAFGPWISDAGHCFKPEIHPSEQIWWRRRTSSFSSQHFLLLSCDQSGRYNDKSDFDETEIAGKDRYLKNVWAPIPLNGVFAILFAVEKGKQVLNFDIRKVGSQNVVQTPVIYKHYNLVVNSDTLVKVNYPGTDKAFKISFEQIFSGLDATGPNMVYGFLMIEANVGNQSTPGGYLFLDVKSNIFPLKKANSKRTE